MADRFRMRIACVRARRARPADDAGARLAARLRGDGARSAPIRRASCRPSSANSARRYGDTPALLSDRETLSFATLAARMNRYSRWALAQGIAPGDTVCLLMPNRPEYLAIWLGRRRRSAASSRCSTRILTGAALAHCIDAAAPRHIIVAAEFTERVRGARRRI